MKFQISDFSHKLHRICYKIAKSDCFQTAPIFHEKSLNIMHIRRNSAWIFTIFEQLGRHIQMIQTKWKNELYEW